MGRPFSNNNLTRRSVLGGIGIGAGVTIAAPWVWNSRARAASSELLVRTPGGAYDEYKRKTVYEPFRALTGISIVPVAASAAKMMAMVRSGQMELDLLDTGDDLLLDLERAGGLEEVGYSSFQYTNPDDIERSVRRAHIVGCNNYGIAQVYNTEKFPEAPQNWADFWDTERFQGPRTMSDIASGTVDLEAALLADGVKPEDLYPLDIDRALASLARIRASVVKFWDTGALSAQMMADKEAYLGCIWTTRAQVIIKKGAPAAIQWNQAATLGQAYGIPKGSSKIEAACAFIDYSLSPDVQSRWLKEYPAVPVNAKAYADMNPDLYDKEAGKPYTLSRGYVRNIDWWAEHRAEVTRAWQAWITH